jgi:hypothetical protein
MICEDTVSWRVPETGTSVQSVTESVGSNRHRWPPLSPTTHRRPDEEQLMA